MQVRTEFPFRVAVTENLFIPLPDGTRLAAKLWRPEGAGPVPAILEYLPYRKHDGTRTRDGHHHPYLAGFGYACLRVDIRGTGESDGIITDEYTETELADGCDVLGWIAAQDWCDGQVAMIGLSWGGFNGLQIAALQPPALKTVIAVGFTDDRYATDIHWIGGCLSKDQFDWSSTMFASNDLPPDPAIVGERWRGMWQQRIEANRPWILDWLPHQRRDAFWQRGSVCEDFGAITVPVYAVSGWADNYSEAVPRLLAGLEAPCRGLVGPWAHSFPYKVAVEPAIGWLQEVVRWCDHWMKGRETGIMDEPLYRVWMQEGLPPQTCYTERPGRWVGEDHWPSPRIEARRMALGAGGVLGGPGAGVARVCSPLWVGLNAGEIGRYGGDADWPGDQREDDGGSLVFLSEPLAERVEILGAPRLHLRFASDKPLALVAARLNDVWPDGRSARVTLGLLNLTHRNGHDAPEALVPGEMTGAVVEMDDIAHAFEAGHRIAVALSTVYWPVAWPSPELVTLTVHCGESWLELPVRPPRPEDAQLRAFDPPEAAETTPHRYLPVEEHPRRITRDLLSGRMTVDFGRWTETKEMPDIGQTYAARGLVRHEITEGDPLSARTLTDYRVEVTRADTVIEHHSTGVLSCDATQFRVEMELVIREGGAEVFRRRWDERIARDHL
jgi:predicted acyl esterase